MKSVHILKVTYSSSSFKIKSFRFDNTKQITWKYNQFERYEQVIEAIRLAGYTITGRDGWDDNADYFVVEEFKWFW